MGTYWVRPGLTRRRRRTTRCSGRGGASAEVALAGLAEWPKRPAADLGCSADTWSNGEPHWGTLGFDPRGAPGWRANGRGAGQGPRRAPGSVRRLLQHFRSSWPRRCVLQRAQGARHAPRTPSRAAGRGARQPSIFACRSAQWGIGGEGHSRVCETLAIGERASCSNGALGCSFARPPRNGGPQNNQMQRTGRGCGNKLQGNS